MELSIEGQLLLSDQNVGVKVETFNRGDGTVIGRYKLYRTFKSLTISATIKDKDTRQKRHILGSPGINLNCPTLNFFVEI